MKNLRPFQIGVLALFAVVGVVSVGFLATYSGITGGDVNPYGERVVVWGSFPQESIRPILLDLTTEDDNFSVVEYLEVDERTFEDTLVNAIAEDRSPDLVIIEGGELVTFRPKLLAIPYDTISLRTLRDVYLDGVELFARSDGLYAIPLFVDPMVMYWNRDIFANAGLAEPPNTWEALTNVAQRVTLRDATRTIIQSAVAFGEYRNVLHAKDVLITLLLQSGSRMITETDSNYAVELNTPQQVDQQRPFNITLQFFIEFSNANSPLYSWNRTWQDDRTAFVSEELALYFAPGSEYDRLRALNPNFNFDVTNVPQGAGATVQRTAASFYGLSILKASSNPQGAYLVAQQLGRADVAARLSEVLDLAPVHRATIAAGSSAPERQVVYQAALNARGWLDPAPAVTNTVLREMVESVTSNRVKVNAAVSDAVRGVELAF